MRCLSRLQNFISPLGRWAVLAIILIELLARPWEAQGQTWQWANRRNMGGVERVIASTHNNDAGGGVVVAERKTSGFTAFGPYLTKIDGTGAVVWSFAVHPYPGPNYRPLTVEDIEATTGGYYVVGWLAKDSTVTLGTSTLTAPSVGNSLYRAFLSENGVWQSAVMATFSETVYRDMALLRTDNRGKAYVAGIMGAGTAVFGSHSVTVTPSSFGTGAEEYVVAAYNPAAGSWDWASVTNSSNNLMYAGVRYIHDMTVRNGVAWITGILGGPTANFPRFSGPPISLTTGQGNFQGFRDVFVASAFSGVWGSAGNFISNSMSNGQVGGRITVDGYDNVYITGYNPVGSSSNGVSTPPGPFLAKFSYYTGTFQWACAIPQYSAYYTGLAGSETGPGVYISGYLGSTFAFGATTLSRSATVSDYIGQVSQTGSWEWVTGLGGTNATIDERTITARSPTAIYLAASHNGRGLTLGTTILPNVTDGGDTFLARLLPGPAPIITSFTPSSGLIGTTVVITGANFTGATLVSFNGTTAPGFVVDSPTQITVVVPVGATMGPISITAPGGTGTSTPYFYVTVPPIITWTGAISNDWNTPGNWSTNAVPTASHDVVIPSVTTHQPTISGLQTMNSVAISNGATLTIANNIAAVLSLTGNLTNNGALNNAGPAGTVSFSGNVVQTVSGSSTSIFSTLSVGASAAGVVLNSPVRIIRVLAVNSNLNANGNLTLLSDAQNTALVLNNGTGAVLGTATVQRYLDPSLNSGLGYRHFSSPVSGNSLADLTTATFAPQFNAAYNTAATPGSVTPFPTVFGYDQSRVGTVSSNYATFDQGWYSPSTGAASTPDNFTTGRGYTVNLLGTEKVDFTGTLHTGDYALALARNTGPAAADAGWHLVGNPYPAPLDWNLVAAADRPNLDGGMYVYESSGLYGGSYRSYVNNVGSSSYIGMGQGFFVRVAAGQASGSLTFRNAQRISSYATQVPVRRGTTDTRPLVQLRLRSGSLTDDLFAYAETGATADLDGAFDAVKLPNPNGLNVAAMASSGQELAIQGLPAFTSGTVLPLTVTVPAAGSNLFTATLSNLPAGLRPYLTDAATGTRQDLTTNPAYTFTAAQPGAVLGRFAVVFGPAAWVLGMASTTSARLALFPNPTRAQQVTFSLPAAGQSRQVQVLDALGHVVHVSVLPAQATHTTLRLTGIAPGFYVVRCGAASGKLVVE